MWEESAVVLHGGFNDMSYDGMLADMKYKVESASISLHYSRPESFCRDRRKGEEHDDVLHTFELSVRKNGECSGVVSVSGIRFMKSSFTKYTGLEIQYFSVKGSRVSERKKQCPDAVRLDTSECLPFWLRVELPLQLKEWFRKQPNNVEPTGLKKMKKPLKIPVKQPIKKQKKK